MGFPTALAFRLAWLGGLVACGEPAAPLAPLPSSPGELGPEHVVAQWEGGALTLGELEARRAPELRALEIEYRTQRFAALEQGLDGAIDDALLAAEAKRRGLPSTEELVVTEIEEKTAAPTDAEIEAFYAAIGKQLGGAPLEEVRPLVAQELHQRAMAERYTAYVGELRQRAKVVRDLPYPELPRVDVAVDSDDPVLGAATAPITVVEFGEFECAYCATLAPVLARLVRENPGRVRLVHKDFPLDGHHRALPAAIAAHCAGEQDHYWEMRDLLFAAQADLGDGALAGAAAALGLDAEAFHECQSSGRWEKAVWADAAFGRSIGVNATPTVYVDGLLVAGAQPYERYAELITRELASGSAAR